ncbi:hypothetical protein D3C73_1098630 [compost metagenome]
MRKYVPCTLIASSCAPANRQSVISTLPRQPERWMKSAKPAAVRPVSGRGIRSSCRKAKPQLNWPTMPSPCIKCIPPLENVISVLRVIKAPT